MPTPVSIGPANGAARVVIKDASKAQTMDPSIVPYQDNEEQENCRLQCLWNKQMESAYKSPSGYQQVSVLLISWDDVLDDLNTKDEVCFSLTVHSLKTLANFSRLLNWRLYLETVTTTGQRANE